MDPKIAALYNDAILRQIIGPFGTDENALEALDGFENFIYAFRRDEGEELIGHLEMLPMDRESYGLIHQDAHGGNFFVHEGRMTLFDFEWESLADCLEDPLPS